MLMMWQNFVYLNSPTDGAFTPMYTVLQNVYTLYTHYIGTGIIARTQNTPISHDTIHTSLYTLRIRHITYIQTLCQNYTFGRIFRRSQ